MCAVWQWMMHRCALFVMIVCMRQWIKSLPIEIDDHVGGSEPICQYIFLFAYSVTQPVEHLLFHSRIQSYNVFTVHVQFTHMHTILVRTLTRHTHMHLWSLWHNELCIGQHTAAFLSFFLYFFFFFFSSSFVYIQQSFIYEEACSVCNPGQYARTRFVCVGNSVSCCFGFCLGASLNETWSPLSFCVCPKRARVIFFFWFFRWFCFLFYDCLCTRKLL